MPSHIRIVTIYLHYNIFKTFVNKIPRNFFHSFDVIFPSIQILHELPQVLIRVLDLPGVPISNANDIFS